MKFQCKTAKIKTNCYQTFIDEFYERCHTVGEARFIPEPEIIETLISGRGFPVNRTIYPQGRAMVELINPDTDSIIATVFEDQVEIL